MSQPVERPADLTPLQRVYLRNARACFDTPPTVGRIIAKCWRQYTLFAVLTVLALWYFSHLGLSQGMWWYFGLMVGVVGRDFGFIRARVKLWPVNQVIIDRKKIDELLGEGHDDPNTKS
jgi:hypothetical protein